MSDRDFFEQNIPIGEDNLNIFFEAAPIGLTLVDRNLRFIKVNSLLAQQNGLTVEDYNGKTIREIVPHVASTIESYYSQVFTTGKPLLNQEIRGIVPGEPPVEHYWIASYFPIFSQKGVLVYVGAVVLDITDRKKAELTLQQQLVRERLVVAMQERIRQSLNLEEILHTTVTEVQQFLQADRVLVYQVLPNGTGMPVSEAVVPPFPAILGHRFPEEIFPPEAQKRYSRGRILSIADVSQGGIPECLRKFVAQFGVKAKLVVPIVQNSNLWGLLVAHHCSSPREWQPSEVESLRQLAVQIAIAISQSTLFQQSQSEIAHRKQVETALRESVQRERVITKVLEKIRQTLDLTTIFATTTEELRKVLMCDRVLIYRFNPDWSGTFVAESVHEPWNPVIQKPVSLSASTEDLVSSFVSEAALKEPLADPNCAIQSLINPSETITDTYLQERQGNLYSREISFLAVTDIYEAGFPDCFLNLLKKLQARAYLTVPIFCGNSLWGLLASYSNSAPRQWKNTETNLAVQIGNQLGVALEQAQLLVQMQKQSEDLQQAVIAANTANQAKSEFLANMSHELRTPLNAILGFAQIMNRDETLSKDQKENLEIINRAGEHLLDLINDILEMSKIEAGRITLNENPFNLINLLDNLEKMLRLKAEAKGLQFRVEYDANVPAYIYTDESKLRQVLLNLLGNAIKFTNVGFVALRVQKQQQDSERLSLVFTIEDTGVGIAESEIPLLFKTFGQTSAGRQSQQGTGLGLAISYQYVQLMRGEIQVNSILNQGSLFTFDIKATLVKPTSILEIERQPKVRCLADKQPEYRILVVDDNSESRLLLLKLFRNVGFSVREAANGKEAIAVAKKWSPHLITMDMWMPIMNGYEATKYIKTHSHPQPPKIIALTAAAFGEQREAIFSAGCDDFLHKPFKEDILLEKIRQQLGVKYLYFEDSATAEKQSQLSAGSPHVNWQMDLALMPQNWLTQVYNAACEGNDDLIFELVQQIPEDKIELTTQIQNLTLKFKFKDIIELTKALIHE